MGKEDDDEEGGRRETKEEEDGLFSFLRSRPRPGEVGTF